MTCLGVQNDAIWQSLALAHDSPQVRASGLAEKISPLLALRKNSRAIVAFAMLFLISEIDDLTAMIIFAP